MSSTHELHLIREVAIRYVAAKRRIPSKITRPEEVAQYLRRRVRDDPALSNTWRMDPSYGYSPGGFAGRIRRVPYRELLEERFPTRARRGAAARLAWLLEAIEQEEASVRTALKRVLRERHGRLSQDERGATTRAMAWCHLVASGCQLRAFRELAKESRAELQLRRLQLTLF